MHQRAGFREGSGNCSADDEAGWRSRGVAIQPAGCRSGKRSEVERRNPEDKHTGCSRSERWNRVGELEWGEGGGQEDVEEA